MKLKKILICIISLLITGCVALAAGCSCGGKKNKEPSRKAALSVSESEVSIGLDGVQTWKFNKSDSIWKFDGIYAADGTRVFLGASGRLDYDNTLENNGAYFTVQPAEDEGDIGNQVGNYVTAIETLKNEEGEKSIKLTGKNFASVLTAKSGDSFIERKISLYPQSDVSVSEAEISFAFKTQVGAFREKGYILTHNQEITQNSAPYSFPAITTRLTGGKTYVFTDVMDWEKTDAVFKTARRNENLNGYLELGMLSSEGEMKGGKEYTITENVMVKTAGDDSYYDMIYDARAKYADIYKLPAEVLAAACGNMNVSDWTDAAYGATYDILDSRGRPLGDDAGTWGPYGYQNGGAEAFGALDILKGMTRYAIATEDDALLATCEKYLLQFVRRNSYGTSYIMPLNLKYPGKGYTNDLYFYRAYNGNGDYAPEDSWNSLEPRIGAFKYYSRVINLGELALITGNKEVKDAYLSLMPLIKKLRGENFEQDVEWNFDLTPANMDYENGGSAGAEAMWAHIMYIAAQMQTDKAAKNEYLELCKGSIAAANRQDFDKSSALREYPKPESISYAVKVNLNMYKLTGEKVYLENAKEIAKGIHFYYYAGTNPYTYFQTVGFGYACSRERWEAFMEMVESLVLLAPYLEYTDDPLLLDLFYSLQHSALWCLPINGYPEGYLGGHSDWLDALYVPFEQPTAVLGDNPQYDGGDQSWKRHSKELYGAGEIFTGALTFETFGYSSDKLVSLFNLNAATRLDSGKEEQIFRLWNVSQVMVETALIFSNMEAGTYDLTADGKKIGSFTAAQLDNGIAYSAEGRKSVLITVKKVSADNGAATAGGKTSVSIKSGSPVSTELELSGEGASHFVVYAAKGEKFSDVQKKYVTKSATLNLGHGANQKIYIKAFGVTADGKALGETTAVISSGKTEIGAMEDFGYSNPADGSSIEGWTARAENYNGKIALISDCNGFAGYPAFGYAQPSGYMAVYKPAYSGYDTDTFTKTFSVDLSKYSTFEFYPFTKNIGSVFSLCVSAGGGQLKLLETQSFDKSVYRFDLSELAGRGDVTVKMVSQGMARGFAVERFAFVRDGGAYDGKLELEKFDFDMLGAERKPSDGLYIANAADMTKFNRETFDIGEIDSDKRELEIILGNLTNDVKNRVNAKIAIYSATDLQIPVYETVMRVTSAGVLKINVKDIGMEFSGRYTLKISFTRLNTGEAVHSIRVTDIRLNGASADGSYEVTDTEVDDYVLAKGWRSNWANVNASTGYVYNNDPSKGYASVYYAGLNVNLDITPVMQFTVNAVNDARYSIKVNDGTMPNDLDVSGESSNTGTFSVNLRDILSRGGIVSLRIDLYVIHDMNTDKGVQFGEIAFIESETVYENGSGEIMSESSTDEFTFSLDETPYFEVDVAELTYGSSWMLWLEVDGVRYEIKSDYERVYGKMYTRSKQGVFKYDLRQVLGVVSGEVTVKLIVGLSGDGSSVHFRSLKLAADNDIKTPKEVCSFR